MQGPEEKKRPGKHAAPPEQEAQDDVLRADADLYGDEADIPIRPRKKAQSGGKPGAKKGRNPAAKGKKGKKKKRASLAARLAALNAKPGFRKRRKMFEVVRSDDDARVGTILVFGRRLSLKLLIALAAAVVAVALVFMNNANIAVREESVAVVGLPDDLEDFQLLVISDLNGRRFGDEQSSLLRAINNLDYDALFFLGDMVGAGGDPEPFYELLDGLSTTNNVYFICGDSDPGPYVETPRNITGTLSQMVLEDWILGAIERGATYVDSPVCLTVGESDLWISPATLMNMEAGELLSTWQSQMEQEEEGVLAGLQTDYNALPITSYRQRIAQNFYDALSSMEEGDFFLALSHQPPSDDFIYASASHSSEDGRYLPEPELILAGHYCGGVWRLPAVGAVYIPDNSLDRNGWFPAQEDVEGLSTVGETQVYITGGLSTNADVPVMFFRLFNQPEISLLTLTATLPESMIIAE